MSKAEDDMVKLLISLRDANATIVEAINTYLAERAPAEAKVEKVAELFPKDLADLLIFEVTPEGWKIRPRQYLGSENFAKIVAIVREAKGEYISAGKESHFRVPKTAAK
jgi:hypothetical protein